MSHTLPLIDLQNDYFSGGAMEHVGADADVEQAAFLLRSFQSRSAQIVRAQDIYQRLGANFFLPDTRGVEIHGAVTPVPGESVVVKHFLNRFRQTTLLERSRKAGADQLTIAGVMTHVCVDATVRAAAKNGASSAFSRATLAQRGISN